MAILNIYVKALESSISNYHAVLGYVDKWDRLYLLKIEVLK